MVRRRNLLSASIPALLQGRTSLYDDPVIVCRVVQWFSLVPLKISFVDDPWNALRTKDRMRKDNSQHGELQLSYMSEGMGKSCKGLTHH